MDTRRFSQFTLPWVASIFSVVDVVAAKLDELEMPVFRTFAAGGIGASELTTGAVGTCGAGVVALRTASEAGGGAGGATLATGTGTGTGTGVGTGAVARPNINPLIKPTSNTTTPIIHGDIFSTRGAF